jgi:hypothetical protein
MERSDEFAWFRRTPSWWRNVPVALACLAWTVMAWDWAPRALYGLPAVGIPVMFAPPVLWLIGFLLSRVEVPVIPWPRVPEARAVRRGRRR